jgi:putative phosphoesterase
MLIAIISDIHGNVEALETALTAIRERGADSIVCLGDIVGYGASPNACLELIRSAAADVLLGNHDEASLQLERAEYFNPYARIAAEWTHDELTVENKEFIKTLPFSAERFGVLFVHSSPFQPEEWHYIITPTDAAANFAYFPQPLCFVGHSHVPEVFCEDDRTLQVVRDKKFIVNVGSIGQPRDGDWRTSFGLFDTEAWTYEQVRVEYDVKTAAAKIRKAGLPKALADRLLVGR